MNDRNDDWGRQPAPPATNDDWGREPLESRSNDDWGQAPEVVDETPPPTPTRAVRRATGGQNARIAGALVLGGVAGAAILGPISTLAASGAPAASESAAATDPAASSEPAASAETTAPSTSEAPTATQAPAATTAPSSGSGSSTPAESDDPNEPNEVHGFGGHHEAVSDTSVVAKAIGISEADLIAALQGGQTVAQVAAAHNVSLQAVIDALVADGQAELDAAVKAGTITQAQADAEKAELIQRATDQANGSFGGGDHH